MEPKFQKLRKTPAYRALAEAVIEQILDGRLRAGEPLPTEAQLCEMFGVNRSTVREGIRVLEESNLVRREHARRMVVSRPSHEELGSQVERAMLLHEVTFDELAEAMQVFEPALAGLAAARRSPALAAGIESNLARTADAIARGESLVALDIEFHALIADMGANRALKMAREPVSRLFYPSFQRVLQRVPVAGQRLLGAHRAIAAAIQAGDAAAARDWMHKHILDFRRGLEMAEVDGESPVGAAASAPGALLEPPSRATSAPPAAGR